MNSNKISVPKTAAELDIGQGIGLPAEQRADTSNWTLPPYNRWTFQRVQQFTRTVRVPRAENSSTLEDDHRDLSRIVFLDSAGEQTTVDEMLARSYTDGFLVLHKGKVLSEQYFNGMERSTLHLIMSCSKSVTSAVAGIYIEAGVLDPATQLTHYLPELADSGMAGATLQQALDMQVGVKFNEDYDDLDGDWRHCEVATGWREPTTGYDGPRDQLSYAQTLTQQVAEHGTEFHYQSILTDVIGCCLERASGKGFVELVAEHIWTPMGAEQDLVSIIDSAGIMVFEGGFNICLRDFARFGYLISQDGRYQGQQLVPQAWLQECRKPNDRLIEAFAASDYAEVLPSGAYHNQWWVRSPEKGITMALGIHGQMLYIDCERELMVAKLSSQPEQANIAMAMDQMMAFEAIAESVA
jgi:CubicO group peptidase (beta-lactamase class C family)